MNNFGISGKTEEKGKFRMFKDLQVNPTSQPGNRGVPA